MVFHGFDGFVSWVSPSRCGDMVPFLKEEHQPPLAPQWGLASLLDLLLLPLGLMVCITLYRVTAACGGGLDRCAMISQMTKVSFFFPKVIAQPARPMIDQSMSLRFMNLLSSHSWFMDVLLTPNMIIIGFDRSSPGNQLQDVSNGAGHSNEDPFDWSRC